ncbi:MAG: hypothetical protein MUP98_15580 [Candidatus Aminicenantes bacterium]|nr:hypothetical protein [Candidatus Aminicenantes bacterium]
MKKIFFGLTVFLFISALCFPSDTDFNRGLLFRSGDAEGTEFTPSFLELDSGYLAQKLLDVEKADSLQKTGRILFISGGLLAVMGSILFIGSKDFGEVCCEKKYRSWGTLFLATGSAMVVGGLIMTSKSKKIKSGLALHLNPVRNEAALGYRLIF